MAYEAEVNYPRPTLPLVHWAPILPLLGTLWKGREFIPGVGMTIPSVKGGRK